MSMDQNVIDLLGAEIARRVSSPAAVPEGALPPLPEEEVVRIFNRVQGRWSNFGGPLNAILKFAAEIVLADRAQQCEPVDELDAAIEEWGIQHMSRADLESEVRAFRAATKAPAPSDAPSHETIIIEGENLLCTACGTAAPVPDTGIPTAGEGAEKYDVVEDLRQYAANPGYSHGDYADTMRKAAHVIEALRAQLYHWGAPVSSTPTSGEVEKAGEDA